MLPIKMLPAFTGYLWGGTRLVEEYGKSTAIRPVAESWEISCHPDGLSVAASGRWEGLSLSAILKEHPEFAGSKCAGGELPVLIKLIDARQELSVQVHPADEYARRVENQPGKNEMWYVLDALPGSTMLLGCKSPVSKRELRERIENGTLLEVTDMRPVKAGDCFLIPAGMLHAIGAGILVAEVQQSSNITYRVYDYNRTGADGKPRELHIEKAFEVADTSLGPIIADGHVRGGDGFTETRLADWEYFRASLLNVDGGTPELVCADESFHCLLVVEGNLVLACDGGDMPLEKGGSVFIPAGLGAYRLSGTGRALLVHL